MPVQGANRRGNRGPMTQEQKERLQAGRLAKMPCGKCLGYGHFARDCTNARYEGPRNKVEKIIQGQQKYDIVEDMLNQKSNMMYGQILNEVPDQRKKFYGALKTGRFDN